MAVLIPFLFAEDSNFTLTFNVEQANGDPYDLTGATVVLLVEGVDDFSCSVTSAAGGVCTRTVTAGDFPTPGVYRAQLRSTTGSVVLHTSIFRIQVAEPIDITGAGFPTPDPTSAEAGGILFGGAVAGTVTQDLAHLFWDDTNNVLKLGVGSTMGSAATDFVKIGVIDLAGAGTGSLIIKDERGSTFEIGDIFSGLSAGIDVLSVEGVNLGFGTETGRGIIGTTSNHPFDIFANNALKIRVDASGNFGLGTTSFGTNAATVHSQLVGTEPTSSPTDVAQLVVLDRSGAATARFHYRSEDDTDAIPIVGGIGHRHFEIVRKSADEIVNNSSTLQDDNHLLAALAANEVAIFRAVIRYNSGTTPDMKFAFTVPASCTLAWSPIGGGRWNSGGTWTQTNDITSSGTSTDFQGTGSAVTLTLIGAVINSTNAGNLTLQWAQNTPTAADSTVLLGSYLQVWRI